MFDDLFATKRLSLEKLHSLIKLSEAGSLIRAAKGDFGKQSRFSHDLRDLSAYFGVELTERAGKTIKLTAAGESLVHIARDQFLALQIFRNQAARTTPTLRIAAGDNLTQWLLVPAIGRLRRPTNPIRFALSNLRTKDIVQQLKERRVDFGLLRMDALEEPLEHTAICAQRYAVFVPRRLVPSRGMLTVKDALLSCPHAAMGGDGQLMERLRELGRSLGESFTPELICGTIGQCVAAVETGAFAAVLPIQAWTASREKDYIVVEDDSLAPLARKIVLAWQPRTMEMMGDSASQTQQVLVKALKEESAIRGATD